MRIRLDCGRCLSVSVSGRTNAKTRSATGEAKKRKSAARQENARSSYRMEVHSRTSNRSQPSAGSPESATKPETFIIAERPCIHRLLRLVLLALARQFLSPGPSHRKM